MMSFPVRRHLNVSANERAASFSSVRASRTPPLAVSTAYRLPRLLRCLVEPALDVDLPRFSILQHDPPNLLVWPTNGILVERVDRPSLAQSSPEAGNQFGVADRVSFVLQHCGEERERLVSKQRRFAPAAATIQIKSCPPHLKVGVARHESD